MRTHIGTQLHQVQYMWRVRNDAACDLRSGTSPIAVRALLEHQSHLIGAIATCFHYASPGGMGRLRTNTASIG